MAGGEGSATAGAPEMGLDISRGGAGGGGDGPRVDISRGGGLPSFEFAFNTENFSDRVLRLEVVVSDGVAGGPLPDLAFQREELRPGGSRLRVSPHVQHSTS